MDEACRQALIQQDEQAREVRERLEYEQFLLKLQLAEFAPSLPVPPLEPPPPETHIFRMDTKLLKFIGGGVVTLPVMLCALYVIIAPTYGDADKKWAYGAVGTLLGFWLGAG